MLPLPPEKLRVWVGPFADGDLFRASGNATVRSIVELCGLDSDARVLEVGCGCGRVAAALVPHLSEQARYDGFDVAAPLIDWCRQELEPRLPQFHFRLADDVFAGGHNPAGHNDAAAFAFPYANDTFDLAILFSILTHMLPDAIENYLRQTARILVSGGSAFISVLLFDLAAETAVRNGTTIFDFRHQIGPCLTFDPGHPEQGIACGEAFFFKQSNVRASASPTSVGAIGAMSVRTRSRTIMSWPRRRDVATASRAAGLRAFRFRAPEGGVNFAGSRLDADQSRPGNTAA